MAKKFIIRLLLFLFCFTCINFILDKIYKINFNAVSILKDKQLLAYKGKLKYLLIGDSYIQCGINPMIFKNSFNSSSPQESYPYTYYKLRYIVEKVGKKPENIFLQADPSSFTSMRTVLGANNSYWFRIANYREMAIFLGKNEMYLRWIGGKFFSYVGKYRAIKKRYLTQTKDDETDISDMILGYKPWMLNFDLLPEKQQRMQVVDRTHTYFRKNNYFDSFQLYYFERILQYSLLNHIGVYIIRLPATNAYLNEVKKYINLDSLNLKVEKIIRKYPNYKGMLDYQFQFKDHPDYFYNPDHLNYHGAKALSELLNSRLN
jgi:hypothetical protein